MELWIRSQDKMELLKAQDIHIREDADKTIHMWDFGVWKTYLGHYKTKERALEVLDEIQDILKPKIFVKSGEPIAETCDGLVYRKPDEVEIQELSIVVYEMPKE